MIDEKLLNPVACCTKLAGQTQSFRAGLELITPTLFALFQVQRSHKALYEYKTKSKTCKKELY